MIKAHHHLIVKTTGCRSVLVMMVRLRTSSIYRLVSTVLFQTSCLVRLLRVSAFLAHMVFSSIKAFVLDKLLKFFLFLEDQFELVFEVMLFTESVGLFGHFFHHAHH